MGRRSRRLRLIFRKRWVKYLTTIVTFGLGIVGAYFAAKIPYEVFIQEVTEASRYLWYVITAVAIFTVLYLLSHLYPKKEY